MKLSSKKSLSVLKNHQFSQVILQQLFLPNQPAIPEILSLTLVRKSVVILCFLSIFTFPGFYFFCFFFYCNTTFSSQKTQSFESTISTSLVKAAIFSHSVQLKVHSSLVNSTIAYEVSYVRNYSFLSVLSLRPNQCGRKQAISIFLRPDSKNLSFFIMHINLPTVSQINSLFKP